MGKEKFTKKIELSRNLEIVDIDFANQTLIYIDKENEETSCKIVDIFKGFKAPFILSLKQSELEEIDDDYIDN